ncbi:MAG TPA: hypothetical protein VL523_13875 [Terriglobia bacterium]|nr:hypothetical protein [Terriglobia bacterium]
MKKLFALLFAAALAVSLAMPVYAGTSAAQDQDTSMAKPKKTKKTHAKKTKAPKKDTTATPPQQ